MTHFMPLGQLRHLPRSIAENPFHPLIVRFSRFKLGSYEALFSIEERLVRYSWLGLFVLFALVLPPFEEIPVVSNLVRIATMVYPCFFIWSLTRLGGVELMQLILEGRWTAEVLTLPLTNRQFTHGFVTPIWIVFRQYLLISVFSLGLYSLETETIVYDEETGWLLDNLYPSLAFNFALLFSTIGWTMFTYLARLFVEVRLRNGLLKGLATLALFLGVGAMFMTYLLLFIWFPRYIVDPWVLGALGAAAAALFAGCILIHLRLRNRFRRYLEGQLDLDMLIFDEHDPRATAWAQVEATA